MTSEIEVLKLIWKHGRKSSVRLLAGSSNFGIDYTRHILGGLLEKRMIAPLRGRRDWFIVTPRGKKILVRLAYIQPEVKKRAKPMARVNPSKKQRARFVSYAKPQTILFAPEAPVKVVLTHNLDNQVEEQKLKLGTFVEKAAKSLRGILSALDEGRR